MSEETPNFSIDPQGEMNPPTKFTHNGHQVESCRLTLTISSANTGKSKLTTSFGVICFLLIPNGGRPSENVNRPAGEVIDHLWGSGAVKLV